MSFKFKITSFIQTYHSFKVITEMKFYKKLRFVIDDNIRSLIYFLIFGLILMSILEFISLGSIPLLVGYLIEPKQMSVFLKNILIFHLI